MNAQKHEFIIKTYFNEQEYLHNKTAALNVEHPETPWTVEQTKQALAEAKLTPLEHFIKYGAWEHAADGSLGINPSHVFDVDSYYTEKQKQCEKTGLVLTKEQLAETIRNASLDPLSHYSEYGYKEGLVPRMDPMLSGTFSTPNHIPVSKDNRIDSLLSESFNWNALGKNNTISFAFAQSQDEIGKANVVGNYTNYTKNLEGFSESQQKASDEAFSYLSEVTGIQFVKTDVEHANFVLCSADLDAYHASGMTAYYLFSDKALIVMDTKYTSDDLHHGSGRQTLLHELGHALGLKHPFEDSGDNHAKLDTQTDSVINTLMSYTYPAQGDHWFYTTASNEFYSPYDIMALGYLYGSDGLNGTEGLVYTAA